MSETLIEEAEYDAALDPAEQALALQERDFGRESLEVATALHQVGRVCWYLGRLDRAVAHHRRALHLREELLGDENRDVGQSLNSLAMALEDRGEFEEALTHYNRSLEIRLRSQREQPESQALALHNQAKLYKDMGAYDKALPLLQQSLAIAEEKLGSEHKSIPYIVHTMGSLYFAKGEYEKSEAAYRRALSIRESGLGPEHPDLLYSINGLANVYYKKGQHAQSATLYRRGLELAERVLGPEHPRVGAPIYGLALVHTARGEYAEALDRHARALTIRESHLPPGHNNIADSLSGLGDVYELQGEHGRAKPLRHQALRIREDVLGTEHPRVADSLDDLALNSWARGDHKHAIEYFERALNLRAEHFVLTMEADSAHAKRMFLTDISSRLSDVIAFSVSAQADPAWSRLERERVARAALRMLLQHKGRVLDSVTTAMSKLRGRLDPEDRKLLDRYQSNRTRYATLMLRGTEPADATTHAAQLRELQTKAESLERDISMRSETFRAMVTPVSVAAVQNTLVDGTALIEWASYRPRHHHANHPSERHEPDRYAACILLPIGAPVWVDLGPSDHIDGIVAQWRMELQADMATSDSTARTLDALIMEPLRERMGGVDTIYMAPYGALNLIPFAALMTEEGEYLLKRYGLHYHTSGRDRIRLPSDAPARSGPMVVANPRYDLPGNPQRHNFRPLDSVVNEAREVAGMFADATLLLGEEATEPAIKQAHGPALLHIATHGYFEPLNCGGEREHKIGLLRFPELQSGLALAGANGCRTAGPAEAGGALDDGLLTAIELASLDLHGTKLAVLSACDTAVGTTEIQDRWGAPTGQADGVYGLRRALTIAGAEAQLVTLWKVDDHRTQSMMNEFYGNIVNGMSFDKALRAAQLDMILKGTASPKDWAGYILAGADGVSLGVQLEDRTQAERGRGPAGEGQGWCRCNVGAVGQRERRDGAAYMITLLLVGLVLKFASRDARRPRHLGQGSLDGQVEMPATSVDLMKSKVD